MTLTPAYGRDYKSKKEVQADWDAGKDFVVADMFSGRAGSYITRHEAEHSGITSVNIRYQRNTKVCVIKVQP